MNYFSNSIYNIFSYFNINNLVNKLLNYIRIKKEKESISTKKDDINKLPIEPISLEETPLYQNQDLQNLINDLKELDELNTFVVSKILRINNCDELNYGIL
jgi:hypothetical protein